METLLANPWVVAAPGLLAILVIFGERIAALTANKTDDAVLAWIHKALSAIGLKFPDVK